MSSNISTELINNLSKLIAERMGLNFPKERWSDLERGICSAARESGNQDPDEFIRQILVAPLDKIQIEILAGYLTIGETYFFREPASFENLERVILPELVQSYKGNGQRLRIWSAGCCTGEEPYSIAMTLSKIIPDLKDWNVSILATDINPRFLKKATQAEYTEWAFRETPPWVKQKFFKNKSDGHYEISPHVKKMVTFSYLNLAEDVYPSLLNNTNAMNVIFCRNVLMYFTPEKIKKVIQNLFLSLVDGGWLIVSPAETAQVLYDQFETVNLQGMTAYRKNARREATITKYFESELATGIIPQFQQTINNEIFTFPDEVLSPPIPPTDRLPSRAEDSDRKPPESEKSEYDKFFTLYQQGRYLEAEEKLLKLLSFEQVDSAKASLLARIYADQGKLNESLKWCEKAIALDKLNPELYYLHALISQEQGDLRGTNLALKRALYLDPNFIPAHFALGNLALREEKFNESRKHMRNALLLLGTHRHDEILPESEGITVGRLIEIIRSTTNGEDLS